MANIPKLMIEAVTFNYQIELQDMTYRYPNTAESVLCNANMVIPVGKAVGIARALFTDPELIIMDEATSALDNEIEAAIMDAINALHGKKTQIIIAHRLTTIKECDMVYRVENGQIVLDQSW